MKVEYRVGLLALVSFLLVIFFSYLMGFISPFSNSHEINVMYNYAGGIEEGSPVRVMGIKVGKVKSIAFVPDYKMADGEEVKLKITVTVDKKAWTSVRKDSRFFINLAGVIGEKFLEISPGSMQAAELTDGEIMRGEDPPRIDQLISQGYGLAGKLIEIVNKNEGSLTNTLAQLDKLTSNFNKTLALLDKTSKNKEMTRLVDNAVKISDDMAYLTTGLRSKRAEESYELMRKLLFRLEPLDAPAIKKFFQQDGVRARIL